MDENTSRCNVSLIFKIYFIKCSCSCSCFCYFFFRENLELCSRKYFDHEFQMHTFENPTKCNYCSKYLKGLIHQGYRCKTCAISVHKGCISSAGRCRPESNGTAPLVCDRQLSEFNWFAGQMSRDAAEVKLQHRRPGTYLLRIRPQVGASNAEETIYALSLQ